MAKQQHWLVREDEAPTWYYAYEGTKPKRATRGQWQDSKKRRRAFSVGDLEAVLPPNSRPNPGDDPVLLGEW